MISEKVQQGTNVWIDIKIPELLLEGNITFVNLHSVTINGEPGLTTISCTAEHAGIVFNDIADMIRLNNLKFISCGSIITNVFKKSDYISALVLVYCRNVEISRVIVERSKGIGLMIKNHQGGVVNIKSSTFKENQLPQEKLYESVLGGGGIYIELGHILKQNYSPVSFHLSDCIFKDNVAHTKHYKFLYTNILGEVKEGYGRGGGVHLSIENGVRNAKVSFSNCKFISNQAYVGGGLAIKLSGGSFDQKTTNITIEIKDSLFEHNGCHHAKSKFGGGLSLFSPTNLSSTLSYKSVLINCHYLVSNVTFSENCATLGGGVVYFSDRSRKVIEIIP